ncbi:glycosyl hydrolase family 95 catalytic domain-containing protein [Chitinophaga sp. NPDC101104]|uniref:glycosyl hydrolase family 95 catalytic domain-containing protein n=1 Tax=Chitinophaga sp. NPDC101104 TaxID=3390561 RepID=UPI003D00278F
MKRLFTGMLLAVAFTAAAQPKPEHNLRQGDLPRRWDEAMPLGNGMIGALIWQKADKLRFSLDRVDLWDDRPMANIDKLTFKYVTEQVHKKDYTPVQQLGDVPYEANAAPTKIPGASLELDMKGWGNSVSSVLDISNGVHEARFASGAVFRTYVHAGQDVGVFSLEGADFSPELIAPLYVSESKGGEATSVDGQSLARLGYGKGTVTKSANAIRYRQPTYEGHFYEVLVEWTVKNGKTTGWWTITPDRPAVIPAASKNEAKNWKSHAAWWAGFWKRSSIQLPEPLLEKQYYLDMYKFGSVARAHTPPISLQAVWTADNSHLPPWKGDFHHDLNTQLSYWPGYTANHTDLTEGFTNWLWNTRAENERYTKQYFGVEGLNVPGVTTLTGKPMGGWVQYSFSPTVAAWLAQHFYWQWKFSGDEKFLRERCKPWFDRVAVYLKNVRVKDPATGVYKLPLSSSPEYHDNSIDAWFTDYTNYDLALIRFFFTAYAEVAAAAGDGSVPPATEALKNYPELFSVDGRLAIAPGHPQLSSHRHHSNLMAIYPVKVLSYDRPDDRRVIDSSLAWMSRKGTRAWVGYSFAWAACLYAQTGNGDSTVSYLRKFASNFVLSNSFHVNGDQKGGQYSGFTYRPFTLEGNFAYAQGVHEMLLQTRNGVVLLFPATPKDWKAAGFQQLRSESGCLVSASLEGGKLKSVTFASDKNQTVKVKRNTPVGNIAPGKSSVDGDVITVELKKGRPVTLLAD